MIDGFDALTRRRFLQWSAAATLAATGVGCGGGIFARPPSQSKAQNSLHLVCGNGSLAWFQLLWPHVEVAQSNAVGTLAIHEPASAGTFMPANPTTGDHEWFATSQAPWIDAGGNPYPGMEITSFMAGRDETHTQFPSTAAIISGNADLLAGAAAIQVQESSALLPVIGVDPVIYGLAPNSPPIASVPNADGLIDLFNSAAGRQVITIDSADMSLFGIADILGMTDDQLSPTQRQGLFGWGKMMIVVAKAFQQDLTNNAIVGFTPGPTSDTSWVDPHESFGGSTEFNRTVNAVGKCGAILEGFYQYLNGFDDPRNAGKKIIDNIVITAHGDTPHTPLQAAGWPDATPDACNWIYVVGKGYLKHGWFGRVHTAPVSGFMTSGFDGTTGDDVPGQLSSSTSTVAGGAIAYAIAKGDSNFVSSALGAPLGAYAGLVRAP